MDVPYWHVFCSKYLIMNIYSITLICAFSLSLLFSSLSAQSITLDFENDTVAGGTLVLLESGTGATDSFASNRFDEKTSAAFEIQGITSIGTLGVTASALIDDINVTGSGLQDGSSGYNEAGEGTSFVFSKDVIITSLDWVSFTADTVTLSSGMTTLGTFTTGTIIGSTDFTNSNPATMNIAVSAGDAFTIKYGSDTFYLGQLGLTAVPEPSSYTIFAGFIALALAVNRRCARV